jgi:hypothetical protein
LNHSILHLQSSRASLASAVLMLRTSSFATTPLLGQNGMIGTVEMPRTAESPRSSRCTLPSQPADDASQGAQCKTPVCHRCVAFGKSKSIFFFVLIPLHRELHSPCLLFRFQAPSTEYTVKTVLAPAGNTFAFPPSPARTFRKARKSFSLYPPLATRLVRYKSMEISVLGVEEGMAEGLQSCVRKVPYAGMQQASH